MLQSLEATLQKEVTAAHLALELQPERHPPDTASPREKPRLCLCLLPTPRRYCVVTACVVTSPGICRAGHVRFSETEFRVTHSLSFIVFSASLH